MATLSFDYFLPCVLPQASFENYVRQDNLLNIMGDAHPILTKDALEFQAIPGVNQGLEDGDLLVDEFTAFPDIIGMEDQKPI
jgi:hypothetical protein